MGLPASSPAIGGPSATPTANDKIVDVRIEGNHAVSLQKVTNEIRTRPGRNFDQVVVVDDIRRLNATRKFIDVRPLYQRVPDGVIVTYQLVERPMLMEVSYVGNKAYKTSEMKKQTELEAGSPLDIYQVEEGRRKLENFYHEKGFNNAQVVILEGNKTTDHRAVYMINEGEQQKVFWTYFIGNNIASSARLRTLIDSTPGTLWIFKGYVETKKIETDIEKLTAYYQNLGFFQVKIGREIEFGESGRWASLTFVINEGPRYVVRNVTVIGNKKFPAQELLNSDLKLTGNANKFFDQGAMLKDTSTIRDVYGTKGYVFADVKAEPRFLEEPGKVDLVYNIVEGDRYRIGKINVHVGGENPHTKLNTVMNRLGGVRPGEIANTREIKDAERRLKGSGLYKVDPQNGLSPKIVFVPPGVEDADRAQYAEKPGGSKYRGQSPDGPTSYVLNYPVVDDERGDKYLIWDVYVPDDASPAAAPVSPTTAKNIPTAQPAAMQPLSPATPATSSVPGSAPWQPTWRNR